MKGLQRLKTLQNLNSHFISDRAAQNDPVASQVASMLPTKEPELLCPQRRTGQKSGFNDQASFRQTLYRLISDSAQLRWNVRAIFPRLDVFQNLHASPRQT